MASRAERSLKNALTGVGGTAVRMGSRFLTKTVFIYILGAEYVGLQGFLQNVVGFLNITELGIGTAIVFSLYRVLAEADEPHIAAIMHLYKKLYRYVGTAVLIISIGIVPLLPLLIKNIDVFPDFWVVYSLYVLDTLLTYWFYSYRNAILQADQKQYITNLINLAVLVFSSILQIIILYGTHSFSGFLLCGIICKIGGNLYLKKKTDTMYPYLLMKDFPAVPSEIVHDIKVNVRALVIYNGGWQLNVVLDTMLISYFLDIVTVGKYSNYFLFFNAFISLTSTFFGAFTASLGNLYIKETKEKNAFIFRCLNIVNFSLAGILFCVFSTSFSDFITLWIGKAYLFDSPTHYLLIIAFSSHLLGEVILQFRNAYGLFDKGKYRPLVGDILNAIISILLAQKYGVIGITLGTLISSYLTFWWFDSWMIYHYGFHQSVVSYYKNYWIDAGYILLIGYGLIFLHDSLNLNISWISLCIELLLSFSFGCIAMWVRYRGKEEYVYIRSRFIEIIRRKRGI